MEERIIDDPRKIKVKKNAVGGVEDATDELAPDAAAEEEELEIALPEEEELDEDLVGLAPSKLQEELARREREEREARAESERLTGEGKRALESGDYDGAEPFFAQALLYDGSCVEAAKGIWICRTRNFAQNDLLLNRKNASELSEASEEVRAFVLSRTRGYFAGERAAAEKEAAPLREAVEAGIEKRRAPFRANRNYYLLRFAIFLGLFVLFAIASGASAGFIVRTRENVPVVLTAAFGGISLLFLAVSLPFARKLYVAQRLVSDNERMTSTEEGARLALLEERIEVLSLVLDGAADETQAPEETGEPEQAGEPEAAAEKTDASEEQAE